MKPEAEKLKKRAAEFARRAVKICLKLPDSAVGRRVSEQLTESSTSMSSNYRAACRARSHAEFVSKIGQVEEEADESLGWLEFIISSELLTQEEIAWELNEADELTRIFTASHKTAKERQEREKERRRRRRKPR